MQNIQTSLLPFNFNSDTIEIPEGLSLQEIVDRVFPRKIRGVNLIVMLGDEAIPRALWGSIKPKQAAMVSINVVPGKDGGKNPLAMIQFRKLIAKISI